MENYNECLEASIELRDSLNEIVTRHPEIVAQMYGWEVIEVDRNRFLIQHDSGGLPLPGAFLNLVIDEQYRRNVHECSLRN